MAFRNLEEAGGLLAQRLAGLEGTRPLVLAVPRGAVPLAEVVAEALGGELDLLLVGKVESPRNPEITLATVGENGDLVLDEAFGRLGLRPAWLESEVDRHLAVLRELRRTFTPHRACPDPRGRTVVVVETGVATGAALLPALALLARRRPSRLVVALALAPQAAVAALRDAVDEVACLETPSFFYTVGQLFNGFSPVSDGEVIRILARAAHHPSPPVLV